MVFRGTYHGAEVAVKVIQPPEGKPPPADKAAGPGGGEGAKAIRRYASQSFLDASELAIGLNVVHPNVVCMLTFFTDVQLGRASASFDMGVAAAVQGGGAATSCYRTGQGPRAPKSLRLTPWQQLPGADLGSDSDSESEDFGRDSASPFQCKSTGTMEPRPAPGAAAAGGFGRGSILASDPDDIRLALSAAAAVAAPKKLCGVLDPGTPAIVIVMEYADSGSLLDAMDRGWLLAPHEAGAAVPPGTPRAVNLATLLTTLLEMALALRHLHGLNLVHCGGCRVRVSECVCLSSVCGAGPVQPLA